MPYSRGDVVLIAFPDSTLQTFKRRPALIVQADSVATGLHQRIIALITSNMTRTGPTRVAVLQASQEGVAMGILTDSVIVTDNLVTVLERVILRAIGPCPIMDQVDTALRVTLNL